MFDEKTLKAKPGVARRLLQFAQMNNMIFDEDLVALAMEGLVCHDDLKSSGILLDNSEMSVLQHIKDWEGRAMVLTPDYKANLKLGMAHLATCDGRSLILADPKNYVYWINHVKAHFPDKKISVFGNPRYAPKHDDWPDDIQFVEKPDLTADVFVTSYGGMIWNSLVTSVKISQTIVEELDHPSAVNYKWQDALKGIFHEVPAPLFLQNIHNLPRDPGQDVYTSLRISNSKAIQHITDLANTYMWASVAGNLMSSIMGVNRNESMGYLTSRGYKFDVQHLFTMFGISGELIWNTQDQGMPMIFHDPVIVQLRSNGKRTDSGLHRIYERERELEAQTGRKMRELVRDAQEGDRPSQDVLGALENTQWASLKAQFMKNLYTTLAHRGTRMLFVTDNKDMVRALNLQFGPGIATLDLDYHINQCRYLMNVDTSVMQGISWLEYSKLKPVYNLIVTPTELYSNPLLLKHTDYVVSLSWNQSAGHLEYLQDHVNTAGAKLVMTVIDGTFEMLAAKAIERKTA